MNELTQLLEQRLEEGGIASAEAENLTPSWDWLESPQTMDTEVSVVDSVIRIEGSAIAELKENRGTAKMATSLTQGARNTILTEEVKNKLYLLNRGREVDDIEPVVVQDDTGASIKVGFTSKHPSSITDSKVIARIKNNNPIWGDTYTELRMFTANQGTLSPEAWGELVEVARKHGIPIRSTLVQTNPSITDPKLQKSLDSSFKTRGYKIG